MKGLDREKTVNRTLQILEYQEFLYNDAKIK